jgi:putative nucleotidyltransferase with HDIG domain
MENAAMTSTLLDPLAEMQVDEENAQASRSIAARLEKEKPLKMATATARGKKKRPSILIVDDELSKAQVLSVALKLAGFHSSYVGSVDEALGILQNQPVDAVISDLRMPGHTGIELLKKIRMEYPRLAFILLTGVEDAHVGLQSIRDGADDHFIKPFQAGDLVRNLRRALERRRIEFQVIRSHKRLELLVSKRTAQFRSAVRSVEANYESTLVVLGAALDLRDGQTGGHSRRVSAYSIEIAKRLGCSETEVRTLSHGALLHDIGKLAVPDSILLKPGALTPEEWAVMKEHVQVGYDLVSSIPFLEEVAELVLTHHERFDGTGYPRNLKGHQIPLCARIFAVADAFDAMTTPRPYQRPKSLSEAILEISLLSGRQFDPQVANAFRDIPLGTLEMIQQSGKETRSSAPRHLVTSA